MKVLALIGSPLIGRLFKTARRRALAGGRPIWAWIYGTSIAASVLKTLSKAITPTRAYKVKLNPGEKLSITHFRRAHNQFCQ